MFISNIVLFIDSEAKDKIGEPKKGISRNSSKAASRDTSRPPSAIDNHIDYFREPVAFSIHILLHQCLELEINFWAS